MKTNKAMREDKSDAASSLQAEKDKLEAQISKLEEDSSSLSTELSELDAALTEATGLRQTEKEKNEATVKEAKQGQEATAKAISVLKEFYAKAGTSFLQTSSATTATVADAPEVFGGGLWRHANSQGRRLVHVGGHRGRLFPDGG